MCLVTTLEKPFITTKDIVVSKAVQYNKQGKLVTICRDFPITDNTLEASGKEEIKGQKVKRILGGFIHCYVGKTNRYSKKAIIPKGSICWISRDFTEICTKKIIFCEDQKLTPLLEIIEDIEVPKLKYNLNLPIIITNWYTANKYCKDNNAYLPSQDELLEVYDQSVYYNIERLKKGLDIIEDNWFWSSTDSRYSERAVYVDFSDGYVGSSGHDNNNYVLAFSAIQNFNSFNKQLKNLTDKQLSFGDMAEWFKAVLY